MIILPSLKVQNKTEDNGQANIMNAREGTRKRKQIYATPIY